MGGTVCTKPNYLTSHQFKPFYYLLTITSQVSTSAKNTRVAGGPFVDRPISSQIFWQNLKLFYWMLRIRE